MKTYFSNDNSDDNDDSRKDSRKHQGNHRHWYQLESTMVDHTHTSITYDNNNDHHHLDTKNHHDNYNHISVGSGSTSTNSYSNYNSSNSNYNTFMSKIDCYHTTSINNIIPPALINDNNTTHLSSNNHNNCFNNSSSIYNSTNCWSALYNNESYITTQNIIMISSVSMLILTTVTERVAFKIMVDQMLPYKFVLIQIIYLLSSIIFTLLSMYKSTTLSYDNISIDHTNNNNIHDYPYKDIIIIAILDIIPFIMMASSASIVTPTMTVILMHSSTIFNVIGSKYLFPTRNYTTLNMIGIVLISLAILVCLCKTIYINNHFHHYFYRHEYKMILELPLQGSTLVQAELQASSYTSSSSSLSSLSSTISSHSSSPPISNILYTFVFFIGASLHGLSTLYKERCVMRWSIHIDNLQLSSQLFFYQFITTIVLALLYYSIQGMNEFFVYHFYPLLYLFTLICPINPILYFSIYSLYLFNF